MPGCFLNRNHVQRADGGRDALLVYDHDDFGMDGDEILMWHTDFPAAGQFQRERMESVLQPTSDLFNDHRINLSLRLVSATSVQLVRRLPGYAEPISSFRSARTLW